MRVSDYRNHISDNCNWWIYDSNLCSIASSFVADISSLILLLISSISKFIISKISSAANRHSIALSIYINDFKDLIKINNNSNSFWETTAFEFL